MNELFPPESNRICGEFAHKSTVKKVNKIFKNLKLKIETLSRKHGSIAYTLRMKDEKIIDLSRQLKERNEEIKQLNEILNILKR